MPEDRGAIATSTLLRFLDAGVEMLAAAREEIDALNVYPVPDGDTGTNMYLTLSAARDAAREAARDSAGDAGAGGVWTALAHGALLGARGNSGVILSQMLGAFATHLGPTEGDAAGPDGTGRLLADAMAAATAASYEAVGTPVEGTILSVAAAASASATACADDAAQPDVRRVVTAAAAAARVALERTPEQLAVLAEAGVVDAGGRGLVVVLDAAEHVVTGRRPVPAPASLAGRATHRIPVPGARTPTGSEDQSCEAVDGPAFDGPAFEVVHLLHAGEADVAALRERLATLGDSLVVVGGPELWKVHVHVDDAGAAVEAALAAGRPEGIRITHLATDPGVGRAVLRTGPRSGRRVVAVAAGDGLARLFGDAGAEVVLGGPGQRPSAGALLDAMTAGGAAEVVLLPNDPDSVATAELAAGELRARADVGERVQVAVIPTHSQLEGLAAMAVHEPGRSLAADVLEMTATARHVRQGAVTLAARRAITMAGPCEPGDVLGVVAGDFVVVGDDLARVARDVVERLLGGGGDMVTVVAGASDAAGGPDCGALAADLAAYVEERHPTVDVVVYDGGQERYPLLVSVE